MQIAPATDEPTLAEIASGQPLSVVFAEGEAIAAIRERGEGSLMLSPPFHVSDQDAYLVLPDDIGLELADMFRDGDLDLLEEAMRDGLFALGTIEKEGRRMVLAVERCAPPAELLPAMPYAETVGVGRNVDPVPLLNELDHLRCTIASAFVDEEGLEKMLLEREHAGTSWRVPAHEKKRLAGVDPTYAWTKRLPDGRVGIECALFTEYEELVLVMRPAALAPLERPRLVQPGR